MEVQHFEIRISVLRYKTMASEINIRWNQQSGVKASSLLLLIPSCCYLIPLRFLSWISSNFLHKFMFLCQNKSVPPGYWWHFHTLQPEHDKLFSNLSNVCIMFQHKILLEPDSPPASISSSACPLQSNILSYFRKLLLSSFTSIFSTCYSTRNLAHMTLNFVFILILQFSRWHGTLQYLLAIKCKFLFFKRYSQSL